MYNYYQPGAYSGFTPSQQPMGSGYGTYQQPVNGLVRVTGYEGARAYASKMPPNSNMAVFDGDRDSFYVIMTDGAGFPTINTYDFSPREMAVEPESSGEYATKAEVDELRSKLSSLISQLSASSEGGTDAQ